MFDDFKKLKEKTKKLTGTDDDSDPILPSSPDLGTEKFMKDAKGTLDETLTGTRASMEEGAAQTTDLSKRAMGKVKGTFTPPKTETERGFLKEVTHFFCSDCNAKLGPMETKKWKNALKMLLGGATAVAGVVLINPILVFKGASSLSSLKKDDRGMIDKLKADGKLKEDARSYLVQCEYCGEWVCSHCYLAERVICNRCAEERGMMEDILDKGNQLFEGNGE